MRKAILMMFVLGFVCMNGYAQKVYKKDGKVYLECTVASGMPAGSTTTTPKCVDGTAYVDKYRNNTTNNNIYAGENDKVFEKLEIDKADMAKPGSTTYTMNWVTAYNGCKSKNTGGVTGWRLPTQRELMLMYIFRVPLGSMTGNIFFASYYYWSSSESNSDISWYVSFGTGYTGNGFSKAGNTRVRCVREL